MKSVKNWGRLDMKFETYTLKELVTIKYGKNQKKVLSDNGDFPIYGTGGLMGYATESLYDKPSVLIGRKGTIDKVRYVDSPFWTVDTLFYTIVNDNIVIPQFLYYVLSQIDFLQYNEGTTIPSLRTETLNRIEINIPSIENQQKILQYLAKIDDKIAINTAINENLEEQAQAIFKSWFVDFEPFGGDMPADWKMGNLLDIADYLNGLAMQKYRPSENEIHLPVLKIKELRQGFCDDTSDICSLNIKPEYIVDDGDVIFSWSGSLLVDFWCGGKCGLNQHLFKVTSNKYDKWFYYAWTEYHLNKFITIAKDMATTMGHIKREELKKAEVIIPNRDDYKKIEKLLQPIYDTIINNRIENNRLSALRDALLPKLMNGEIDVSEIRI